MMDNKELELWVLMSVGNNGADIEEIRNYVATNSYENIDTEKVQQLISGLAKANYLKLENNKVYPKYDEDVVLEEIICLVLEIHGPMQIRDVSTYVHKNYVVHKRITDIETIVKYNRHLAKTQPRQGVPRLFYLKEQEGNTLSNAVNTYQNPIERLKFREMLGIATEEEKEKTGIVIDRQVQERDPCSISELFNHISNSEHINGSIFECIELDEKDPIYDKNFKFLNEKIWEYLKNDRGIEYLYSHQASAINALYDHKNPFITTSNASGKTFTYVLPVIDALLENPDEKFLYISPTKSLAHDQKNTFNDFGKAILGREIAKNFDGHTQDEERKRIMQCFPNVILTNEHMLHYNILREHDKWHSFFKDLKYIIIDEAHWYKGVFGSHVSNLIRRFNIISSFHGAYPQYICISATIGNPQDFAEDLIGKEVVVIDNDGSPSYKKTLVLFEPSDDDEYGSIFTDLCYIIAEHMASQFKTLAFGKSRNMVESMAKVTREKVEHGMKKKIVPYRAGIPRKKRREIEDNIFSGLCTGIISTSAMELGIDIGDLDSVVLAGYPGSLGSFWQRANRAGRSNRESDVFYVPMINPLDQYFLRNPQELLSNNYESALINPDNEKILEQHAVCLRSEINVEFLKKFKRGYEIDNYINLNNYIDYTLKLPPTKDEKAGVSINQHDKISLRGVTSNLVTVEHNGVSIGETDTIRAPKEVFPGAIYMVHGDKYLVRTYNGKTAIVEKHLQDESTYPVTSKKISIEGTETSKELQGRDIILGKGRLKVIEYYHQYVRKNKHGDVVETSPLNFNPNTMYVDGFWLVLSEEYVNDHQDIDFNYALHGLTHTLINLSPIQALCDISDISGHHDMKHENLRGNPGLFIFETSEYGVGLIDNIYENIIPLLEKSHRLLTSCNCKEGCPNCIQYPSCSLDNVDLNKHDTIKLIEDILSTYERDLGKEVIDIREYLREEESKHLEYKETFIYCIERKQKYKPLKEACVKEICAFANSEGGKLIIGVDDRYHNVVGLERDFKVLTEGKKPLFKGEDELELQLNRSIVKLAGPVLASKYVDISFRNIKGKTICVVDVKSSNEPVLFKKDKFYVRLGSSSEPLDKQQMNEYIKDHFR